jgi:hypothetical protein
MKCKFLCCVLPVVEAVMAALYRQSITGCESTLVGGFHWLAAKAAISLATVLVYPKYHGGSASNRFRGLLYSVFTILELTWLGVGSVAFWGPCSNVHGPAAMRSFMWASLVCGFLSLLYRCHWQRKDRPDNEQLAPARATLLSSV